MVSKPAQKELVNALNNPATFKEDNAMKDTFKTITKAVLVLASVFVLLFVVLGLLKIGILYWCYSKIFAFASGLLGLDYYTAVFISTGLTAMLAMALPSFLGSLLIGKGRLIIPIAVTIVAGLTWASVHTVGKDINFDQISGKQNLYAAETPDGKVYCRGKNCQFETKYGIRYVPVTTEMFVKEAKEEKARAGAAREEEEKARAEAVKEAQKKEELAQQEQREREERDTKERIEQLALERERETRQREELKLEAARQRLLAEQQERARVAEAERHRQMARQQELERDVQRQVEWQGSRADAPRGVRVIRQLRVGDLLFR